MRTFRKLEISKDQIYSIVTEAVESINDASIDNDIEDSIFNAEITDEEILYALKSLRRGKSPGEDNTTPEFFITGVDILFPLFE
jgi:hypothetical protein